jgi:hypothetical protein
MKTLNEIIEDAGIEIVRITNHFRDVNLRFKGKEIKRPFPQYCYSAVKNAFEIDLKNYE